MSEAMDKAAETPNELLCARDSLGDNCCLDEPVTLAMEAENSGSGTLTESSSVRGAVTPNGPVAPPAYTKDH